MRQIQTGRIIFSKNTSGLYYKSLKKTRYILADIAEIVKWLTRYEQPEFDYRQGEVFLPPASAGFLLDFLFDIKDGTDMLLQSVGCLSSDYTALYPRRWNSSQPPL
jgi:hypothetical protein